MPRFPTPHEQTSCVADRLVSMCTTGECLPETLDLTQAAVSASSSSSGSYPPSNAIDHDETTYWEMSPGARDADVMNSAWFQIDLE